MSDPPVHTHKCAACQAEVQYRTQSSDLKPGEVGTIWMEYIDPPNLPELQQSLKAAQEALQAEENADKHIRGCPNCQSDNWCSEYDQLRANARRLRWAVLGGKP